MSISDKDTLKNNMGRIGIVVASRFSSTRLPGKALRKLGQHSMLGFLLSRLKSSKLVDELILATSNEESDNVVEREGEKYGVSVYRGSLNDVVDRYAGAAKHFSLDTVIRVTADCPFLDGKFVDDCLLQISKNPGALFTTKPDYPTGLDLEIFTSEVLYWLNNKNDLPTLHREHLTSFFYTDESPCTPKILVSPFDHKESEGVFTVDTIDDYERVVKLVNSFENIYISTDAIVQQKKLMNS